MKMGIGNPKGAATIRKSYQIGRAILAKMHEESEQGCSPFGAFAGYDLNFTDPLFEGAVGILFSVRFQQSTYLDHQPELWHE